MLEHILQPITFAQIVIMLFLTVLFLQSGIDKVVDFAGNYSWLQGHFAKSPLRNHVKGMLCTITLAEVLAGLLALAGAVEIVMGEGKTIALYGAQLAAIDILLLFFGQRIAKEYAGAAALVPYFLLCVGAVVLLKF
ncbi:MAG: DoxX family protein [Phycisphaerales bacterium]|nr:DoxX family protein [Phycisphaerales bacterium]